MASRTVKIEGETVTIRTASALASVAALHVLSKHMTALEPFLRQLTTIFAKGKPGADPVALVMLVSEVFQKVMEQAPHDPFLFVSLLTAIEQEKLEQMAFTDFWAIVKAVAATNDLMALVRMGQDLKN